MKSTTAAPKAPAKKAAPAKSIPEGMHSLTPHLVCAGAAKAIEFYKKAFGATELVKLAAPNGMLMHGSVQIGDSRLMLVDENEGCGMLSPKSLKGSPITIHLQVVDADAAFAQAVKAGATVKMPLSDMFWGDRYGVVEDPFGHHWSIAHRLVDLSPAELHAAAAQAMCQQP
ncbi:MAG: VOC family protein [Chthoniobacter sp.]|uniref:VOC family protein n=1 Tax=Chthoniobacter sp. TaxID=2510640 RepID=UPI0032A7B2B5